VNKTDHLVDANKKEGDTRKALEDDSRTGIKDLDCALKNQLEYTATGLDTQLTTLKAVLDKEKAELDAGDKSLGDLTKEPKTLWDPYTDELKYHANPFSNMWTLRASH